MDLTERNIWVAAKLPLQTETSWRELCGRNVDDLKNGLKRTFNFFFIKPPYSIFFAKKCLFVVLVYQQP
jgi:hypothetical protein